MSGYEEFVKGQIDNDGRECRLTASFLVQGRLSQSRDRRRYPRKQGISVNEEHHPRSKRFWKSWHRLLFIFGVIMGVGACGKYGYDGYQHRNVAGSLESRGNIVVFTHRETIRLPRRPGLPGIPLKEVSTLPPIVESTGLGYFVRRIHRVTIRSSDPHNLELSLSQLSSLGQLNSLSFYDTGVTKQALAALLSHTRVEHLYVASEKLSRRRMPWLNHDGLKWLCVARTQFSDPAIDDLPQSLEHFDATRTRISDQGLSKFKRLRHLKKLVLRRTPTSPKAVNDLRSEMPWCEIRWESLEIGHRG